MYNVHPNVHMYNKMYTCTIKCTHVQYNVHPNVHISIGSDTSMLDYLCWNVHSVFFWEHPYMCLNFHVPYGHAPYMEVFHMDMPHIWKCAMCQCRRSRARWNQSIATNHHLYPPPPPPLPFLQRENPWRVELILLSCIISVTYVTFNISGGILNHDIFLFVPNISSKHLP